MMTELVKCTHTPVREDALGEVAARAQVDVVRRQTFGMFLFEASVPPGSVILAEQQQCA